MTMEKPNCQIIELSAIQALKGALIPTCVIEPDIRENDKTPSWDGELRLYNSEDLSKANLRGRVPVQVKGQWTDRFPKGKAKFQADVADLRNYMADGGTMLFLVLLKNFDNYRIYYASLLPFDLRRLLDEAGEQKTKQIKLGLLQHKYRDGIVRILDDFLLNKGKQGKLLPDIKSASDLKNSSMEIEKVEVSFSSVGLESEEDAFEEIFDHPHYVYVKPKGVEATFAVDLVQPKKIVMSQNIPIEVDGEVLFDHIDFERMPKNRRRFKIGNGISGEIQDNITANFTFTPAETVNEQMRELKLLLALLQGRAVKVCGEAYPQGKWNFTGFSEEEVSSNLEFLLAVDKMLKQLHVKNDLKIRSLSEKEIRNLKCLVMGILDQAPVPLAVNGGAGAGKLTIGNVTVALSAKKDPNSSRNYIQDFFEVEDIKLVPKGQDPATVNATVSPYIAADAETFEMFDNADIGQIVTSIKKHPYSEEYGDRITNLVLELLKYFDAHESADILDVVVQLLEYEQENDSSQKETYHINRLQTEKRRRKLTKDEMQYLSSLKSPGIPLVFQLAANILLESFHEAQIVYDQLEEDERTQFDNFPIAHLWQR